MASEAEDDEREEGERAYILQVSIHLRHKLVETYREPPPV